ncbi:MAG: TIGR04086 family membrane protein [Clostridia bacterium]|nr:TIGR04086 family membrane protein [Clostridia bacterium]
MMNKRVSVTLKGVVLALILTVMFSMLLAAAMYFFDVSDRTASALTFLIGALSCMSGAYAVGKAMESKGLATGGMLGIIYYIVLSAAAIIIKKELSLDAHTLIMLVCAAASGMLGGVLGMPR